jgi:uncharacterized cupin superfamily protein
MPKINVDNAPARSGTGYPPPYDQPCSGKSWRRLGEAAGLTQMGINLLRLPAGQWSSQRHWHTSEDEFVWVVEGEVVLVDNDGETPLKAGDCAGFSANDGNGHHLQNRSDREAVLLVVGTTVPEGYVVHYPDADLHLSSFQGGYEHKDGTKY